MKRTVQALIYFVAASLLSFAARASTYECDGKEMTKGQVIRTLIGNPKTVCIKKDKIEFDEKRGTVKNVPKE